MKKIFLLVGILTLSFGMVNAQTPFWSENFSGGIPAGWSNTGVDGFGTSHTGMWKTTRTGNHGAYAQQSTLASPTSANGFAIFDSDSLDNTGTGNQGTGSAPVKFGTGAAGQTGFLTTSTINCTGHNRVLLQFYQKFYTFVGLANISCMVLVNNGSITDTIDVNRDRDFYFGLTPNPSFKQYDISAVAGNQANVTISFVWNDCLYYYWMLDDIALLDAPTNNLAISRAGSFDYYSYPLSQVDTISYYARTRNEGTANQPNSKVKINITRTAPGTPTVVFADSSAASGVTLVPGVDSALVGTNVWVPTATKGTYRSIVSVYSDSTDGLAFNNADTSVFTFSDSIYAIDNGQYGGAFPIYDGTQTTTNREWVNLFDVKRSDTLTSLIVSFDPVFSNFGTTSAPNNGSIVQGNVYLVDPVTNATTLKLRTFTKKLGHNNFNTAAGGRIKEVGLMIDNTSGNPVLDPGFYAISVVSISNDSTLYITNTYKKVAGQSSGEIGGNGLSLYSNTQFYLRMSFGLGFNPLACSYTRNPAFTLRVGQVVNFFGAGYNASANATYAYTVTDLVTGTSFSYNGKNLRDSFNVADSFNVCLTITDGSNTASYCRVVNVRDLGVGIQEVNAMNIALVPNPTTGMVKISADDINGKVTISITNALGAEVKRISDEANGAFEKSYNLSDLASGMYIVKVQNGSSISTNRLSIVK